MDRKPEEARLSVIRQMILAQINALTAELKAKQGGVAEARRDMWAETHIIRDFDDVANLSALLSEVTIKEHQYAGLSLRLNNLRRMLDSPWFGRIDFTEEGYSETEQIYIGGQGLFDEKNQNCHIYDWRAPISSMYYDYGVGRASFDAPDGTVTGEINLKRQYRIEQAELVYLFDSDLKIDDDILQMELSKSSDAKIKTIINTIQREQNRAIRAEADHVTVFGPAGSGKTSVGLHRLAYLLYRHRGKLTSARARIFSTNNVFSSYIAGIIPELGEEDVRTLDFTALMREYGPENRAFKGPYGQIGCLLGADDVRRAGIVLKHDPAFAAFTADYIKKYTPSDCEDARFNTDIVCEKARIAALYDDRTAAGNLHTKTARALEYVSRRYEEYFKANREKITAFFNDLNDENYSDGEIRKKFDEQKNIVLNDLRSRFFPDTKRLYERVIKAYTRENGLDAGVARFTANAVRADKLLYEDALVMFYIDTLTGRVKKERNVRHILVDEAQDLSAIHHRVFLNLFDNCHFTILADTNQALYPEINITDKAVLTGIYKDASIVELTKSYRSTFEINRFAANLIGNFDENMYYKRFGGEPEIIETGAGTSPAEAAARILKNLSGSVNTVGILLSDAPKAHAFYKALRVLTPATLIADADDAFGRGTMVMAVQYAKGLEFDAVIVPYYGGFCDDRGKRALYLMCTRALHKLFLIK